MSASGSGQGSLGFERTESRDGLSVWRAQRAEAKRRLAGHLGLPLGRRVEVWLRGNIRLTGKLELREEPLFFDETSDPTKELMVDGVPFRTSEIESCVRLD